MRSVKVIIIFLVEFFDIMLMVKEKRIVRILNVKVSNLKVRIKFIILNNFIIIL